MEPTASEKHLHEHSDEEPTEERQITSKPEQAHDIQTWNQAKSTGGKISFAEDGLEEEGEGEWHLQRKQKNREKCSCSRSRRRRKERKKNQKMSIKKNNSRSSSRRRRIEAGKGGSSRRLVKIAMMKNLLPWAFLTNRRSKE